MTRRQVDILALMRDADEEFVYSKGAGYVGLERVGRGVLLALLRSMAISLDNFSRIERGQLERYRINETGRRILRRLGR